MNSTALVLLLFLLQTAHADETAPSPPGETSSTQDTSSAPPSDSSPMPIESPAPTPAPSPLSEEAVMFGEDIVKLRDPFRKPEIRTSHLEAKTELERFAVDAFKLVGVSTGPNRIRALLLAPDGKTYLAYEKAKIGLRGGVIRKITPDSVQVREKVVNIIGQEENVDMEIAMPTESMSRSSPTDASKGSQGAVSGGSSTANSPGAFTENPSQ